MNSVLRFNEVVGDVASVGGKNASLGEKVRTVADKGARRLES